MTDFKTLLQIAAERCNIVRISPTIVSGEGIEFSAEIIDMSVRPRARHFYEMLGNNRVNFIKSHVPEIPIPPPNDVEWSISATRFIEAVDAGQGKTDQYMDARNELLALIRQARRTAT